MEEIYLEQKDFFDFIKVEIGNGKLSHAYLIETNNYDKVDIILEEFIKYILCKNKFSNINCDCHLCNLVKQKLYPDIKYIDPEGASIKKEQLINLMNQFKNKSFYDNKQIYIINDATKLNSSSANTILKFLEEPEDNIIAILVASSRYKVIDTILSRCQILSLKEIKYDFDDEILKISQIICDKNKNFKCYNELFDLLPDRVIASEKLKKVEQFLFSSLKEDLFLDLPSTIIMNIISILEEIINKLQYNVNYKLVLDDLLVMVMEVVK